MLSLPHKSTGTETEVLSVDDTSYTIPGASSLTTGQTYYVRVAARNAVGYGVFGVPNPVAVQPSLQVPGKPSNFQGNTAAGTGITVQWAPPLIPAHGLYCGGGGTGAPTTASACPTGMGTGTVADGGSAITSYKIQWDTNAQFSSPTEKPIYPTSQVFSYSDTITGLQCGNSYYVRIAAANAQGYGSFCGNNGANCDGSVVQVAYPC